MSGPSPEQPWLVADIGGTNARFGLVTEPGGEPHRMKILRCGYHPDLVSAIESYVDYLADSPRPHAACVAVAGPVDGDRFRLTNAEWDFSVAESRRRLGFARLDLINDFTALALALPHLPAQALRPIGALARVPGKPIAVIGPGTRVSAEYLLSGPGLARLHQGLSIVHGVDAQPLAPEQVGERGRHGTDPVCAEALQMFCALLGAFAGNVALTFGARGGVVLGGGILSAIATELIVAPTPALLGASAWLNHNQRALEAA
ncbi:MAG: glucokinase [Pseudonocardiaceae bacterium]